MATPAQILANRADALASTGLATTSGKLASSRNAQTHGLTSRSALLPIKDPAEYATHHDSYRDTFQPQDPIAEQMVAELADLRWRLRRVPVLDAQLLNTEIANLETNPELEPLIRNLPDPNQIVALAFTRLVESKVLQNLYSLESPPPRRSPSA